MKERKTLIQYVLKLQKKYNPDAFRAIYDSLSPVIYSICKRYLKDEAEAQDALQETFIIVYEKINKYQGNGSFEGWVKRIAVNHCLSRLKKRKIKVEIADEHIEHTEQKEFDSAQEKTQIKENLKRALTLLPDGFRTIINLYIIEGYSHQEIAKMLNINEGTSRSQLNRAKAALKKLISARK